jgi:hypothetical protein
MRQDVNRNIENAVKLITNEVEHWMLPQNLPYYRPETAWQKFLSIFWGLKLVRRFIGGTWIRGEEFKIWLKTNEKFPKEWLEKHQHEIY